MHRRKCSVLTKCSDGNAPSYKKYSFGNGYTDFDIWEKKTDIRRASKYIDIITINFFFYVARNYDQVANSL